VLTSYKKELKGRVGGLEEKDPGGGTADPLCYCCATLINKESITVEASRCGHAGLGESKSYPKSGRMSTKWCAYTSTCVSINPSQKA